MRALKFDELYTNSHLSVFLISSKYDCSYEERDYNKLLSVSFPIKGGFGYCSGKIYRFIDTSAIVIEQAEIDFRVKKYAEFEQDLTLSLQISKELSHDHFDVSNMEEPFKTLYRNPRIDHLINEFLGSYSFDDQLLKDTIVYNLLRACNDAGQLGSTDGMSVKPWITKKIETAKEFIYYNSSDNISLSDISSVCNMSVYHFARIFRQLTGHTPYDYLLNVRIEKAKKYLRNETVSAVAFEVGFNSLSNFSATFKKIVGISPTEYQKKQDF